MRVAISGAAGRMGRLMAAAVREAEDLELVGLYGPGHSGETIADLVVSDDPTACATADVVVESTLPDVAVDNIRRWGESGCNVVVGTSGVSPADVERFWPEDLGCLIVPNFSLGAVLMMHFAEVAAPFFRAAEIVELHHDQKVDAPSGTAKSTADRIGAANPNQMRRTESVERTPGVRGGRSSDVPIHSLRLPGLLAHQEVIMGNVGEVFTIRHDSTDRESFMPGVLAAVRYVSGVSGVELGLEGALGI